MNKLFWILWVFLAVALSSYYSYKLFASDDKTEFLIGQSSHGHYQIEMVCEACHTDDFASEDDVQSACLGCHAQELELAHDSHPKKKFNDPRNADLLKVIDARYCISCHTEHQQERTLPMGVTVAQDYCFHCHEEVGDNRPSHKDLPFDSCASAGCHNFHDNRALYEDFLVDNSGQPWLKQIQNTRQAGFASLYAKPGSIDKQSLISSSANQAQEYPQIHKDWLASGHASSVACIDCHANEQGQWQVQADWMVCATCHETESKGFVSGRHGMRLSPSLPMELDPMTPAKARLAFHQDAEDRPLNCGTCHDVHQLDTQVASAEKCLGCHSDEHSVSFKSSPHGQLWEKELNGEIDSGRGVSCATCHLPKTPVIKAGQTVMRVEHNQNHNLRPNEKMVRSVCLDCHGLEFALDALADPNLIQNNFRGRPKTHIESVDWAMRRVSP